MRGPSSDLPAGCDLTSLLVNPLTESVVVSIMDRSDFYHQFASSPSRAVSNTLGSKCSHCIGVQDKGL